VRGRPSPRSAALHRAATLAWIAGKIALPYPSSMEPGRVSDLHRGYADGFARFLAAKCRLTGRLGAL